MEYHIFKEMFPDSKIANKFSLARTKCSYITTYGPLFCFIATRRYDIKNSDNFSISFDESSVNGQTQCKLKVL